MVSGNLSIPSILLSFSLADDGEGDDQGDEDARSVEDEFVLEMADIGGNDEDGGWGQVADPWTGIAVHDANGHRIAVPPGRRHRPPRKYDRWAL